ncbi:hypothetical protein ACVWZV_000326 [Bradyrhizobium sp. GM5.1]
MDTQRQPFSRRTVAILSRGDAVARRDAAPTNGRSVDVFEALAAIGVEARPAIYDESFADAVREQLLAVDGVLVWVNPIQDGRNRAGLDALLRDVAVRVCGSALIRTSSSRWAPRRYSTAPARWAGEATRRSIKPPKLCATSCRPGLPPVRA